jgi:ADP-ribosylglycohydrolase
MNAIDANFEPRDRIRGCILGGAVGDAMGGAFEGEAGPLAYHDDHSWSISDDTQLTLATCEAVSDRGAVDPEAIAANFVRWFRERRITGIGGSTLKALQDLAAGQHWALAGAQGERSAGNGAAMRVAPLAFLLDPDDADQRRTLRDVCRITHRNEEAYVGALAVLTAVRQVALQECPLESVFDAVRGLLPDSRVRERMADIAALPDRPSISDIAARFGSSGYVVDSIPLAVYAAQFGAQVPCEGVFRQVIECGGDTDTIAAIAGQIIGAAIGHRRLPQQSLERLSNCAEVVTIADRFAACVCA